MKQKFTLEELIALEQDAGNIDLIPDNTVQQTGSNKLSREELILLDKDSDPLPDQVQDGGPGFFSSLAEAVKTRPGDVELSQVSPDDLNITQGDAASIAGQFILEPTAEGRARIINKFIPEADFGVDADNNPFFTVNNKKIFLNKKGFSQQDILDIGSAIAAFSPAAKGVQAVTKGAPLLSRAIGQGGGAIATSIGTQKISQELDNVNNIDLGRALVEGGFAGVGEIAFPILGAAAKKVFKGQKLTSGELQSLQQAGVNVEDLTPDNILTITQGSDRIFGDAAQRLRKAEGDLLPIPVPQTTGDISQVGAQRILESRAATGQLGQKSREIMQDFLNSQNQATQMNIELMRRKLGLGADMTVGESGAIIQRKLNNLKNIKGNAVQSAYKQAFDNNIIIPNDTAKILNDRFTSRLDRLFIDEQSISGLPPVKRLIDKIQPVGTGKLSGLNQIEAVRQSVNKNIIGTAGDNATQREAGRALIKEIDSTLDDFIDGGLLGGGDDIVNQFKEARKQYKNFKRVFDDNDIVQLLTSRQTGRDSRLIVDSDDAINAIFNKSSITKKGAAGAVIKLKRVLPKREFALLKQSGLDRIIGRKQVSGDVSAVTLRNNFEGALRENPRLMRALYTKKELQDMSNITSILKRIEDKGISGNTPSERRMLGNLMQSGRRIFANALLADLVDKTTSVITNVRLRDAVKGSFRGADVTPAAVPAASVAIGRGSQDE